MVAGERTLDNFVPHTFQSVDVSAERIPTGKKIVWLKSATFMFRGFYANRNELGNRLRVGDGFDLRQGIPRCAGSVPKSSQLYDGLNDALRRRLATVVGIGICDGQRNVVLSVSVIVICVAVAIFFP